MAGTLGAFLCSAFRSVSSATASNASLHECFACYAAQNSLRAGSPEPLQTLQYSCDDFVNMPYIGNNGKILNILNKAEMPVTSRLGVEHMYVIGSDNTSNSFYARDTIKKIYSVPLRKTPWVESGCVNLGALGCDRP